MKIIKSIFNNPYFAAIRNIKSVLDYDQKKRGLIMIFLLFINAVGDLLGLATIGTLIISSLDDNVFTKTVYTRDMVDSDFQFYIHLGLRKLYDWSGATSDIAFLFYLSILIFIIFIAKNALFIFITYIQTRFGFNVALRLNKKMFKYFYDKGYLFITHSTSGNKVYSIVDIPMRFASNYFLPTMVFTTELVVLVILGIALLFINPKAVMLLLIIIVPVFVIIYRISKSKIKEIGYQRNRLAPLNYAKIYEAMNGYVDIKLSNAENLISSQYITLQKKLNSVDALYFGVYLRINSRTNDIIFGMGFMVIFGFAYATGMNRMDVLQLLGIFAIAAYKFLPSVNRMMGSILAIKNSSFVIDELSVIANTSLSEYPSAGTIRIEKEISLEHIKYKYPESEDWILDDVSVSIPKGTALGIIGESGSGKTTMLKILLRLLKQNEGDIYIDGNKVDNDLEPSFQKLIGYVEQDIFILNDTIRNNIAFGLADSDDAKMWEILKQCRLDQFVRELPDGLDMKLGENGVNLSGGQKQRIGIARALYKDSEILCFDEATSALDNETERAIVESINDLSKLGKTIIIVAHRITTLEKCNRIIELDKGRIVREPSYDALIKEKVLYTE